MRRSRSRLNNFLFQLFIRVFMAYYTARITYPTLLHCWFLYLQDKELATKDALLHSMRKSNHNELDMLQLELQTEREKFVHELHFHESELQMLKVKKRR